MVKAPALISGPPVHKGTATLALVFGVVGIFAPFVGVILGILAITFGIIALRHKTTSVAPAIIGVVTGVFAILMTILVAFLISFVFGHALFAPSDRDRAVTAQINERKDFTVGETAKIGPVTVKITNIQRHYTPTAEDIARAKGVRPEEVLPGASQYDRGTPLSEDEVEYVLVQGTQQQNGSPHLGDDDFEFSSMQLNYVLPYAYTGGLDGYRYATDVPKGAIPFTGVYRIRKGGGSLTLQREVSIWKQISPIVGTEGMPQVDLTYTIKLS